VGTGVPRQGLGDGVLLVSQSTMTFVVVKSVCLLSITILAVTATVLAAVWVARKEGC